MNQKWTSMSCDHIVTPNVYSVVYIFPRPPRHQINMDEMLHLNDSAGIL